MDESWRFDWARPAIGGLSLAGGVCLAAGWLMPSALGGFAGALAWIAAPLIVLALGVLVPLSWRYPTLNRWGRRVCALGVGSFATSIVALLACGDIEGGIPDARQAVLWPICLGAALTAIPLLVVGGVLVLARGGGRPKV